MPDLSAMRHRALMAAIVLLGVALAVAAGTLLDRERTMQQLSKEQVYWSVAQAEIELYRFVTTLEAYGRGEPGIAQEDVTRRFDIFWSRMALFEGGDIAQRVLSFEGAPEAVRAARDIMTAEEDAVLAVRAEDDAEISRLHGRFEEAGLALHSLAVAVNQAEIAQLSRLRQQLRAEIYALVAIVGGMVSGGMVLVLLLLRENRRNQSLALENRQFVLASDLSTTAVMLCRRQDDRMLVVYANDVLRKLAGSGAIEGAEPAILLARRLDPAFAAPLKEALALGRPVVSDALPLQHEGTASWQRMHLTPVAGEDGQIDAIMVEIDDITQEIEGRLEIETARDDAMRANAAKSRFVAVMSHEIRTPMNGVLGALGLIEQRNRDRELNDLIGTAQASGEALLAILNDVLDIARMEAGQLRLDPAPLDLALLVRSVAQAWAPLAAEKGVALEWRIGQDVPPHVTADAARLRQMLVNLVSNAVKFTDSGAIAIGVSLAGEGAEGAMVRFEVSDTGPGIAPEDFSRLFHEYDQVAQHGRGGTGLGLAIVRRMAERMGGAVGVASEPGKGSRFHFVLPLPASLPPETRSDPTEFSLRGLDVLVAEDNATNRLIVSEVLKDLGCRVRLAADGAEALAMAEEAMPDIVLMDIAMPVMDGHEAHRRLRAATGPLAAVPVVALTAYAMADEVAAFLNEGFDAVLPKPVARTALAVALQRLTGRGNPVGMAPAPAIAEQHQAVDAAVLAGLLASLGPDTGRLLVESFLADVGAAVERIETARVAEDLAQLERDSHMLSGLAATFGLLALSATARALNRSCRTGDGSAALLEAEHLVEEGRLGLAEFTRLTAQPGFGTLATQQPPTVQP